MLRYAFRRQSISILSLLALAPLRYTEIMNRFNADKSGSGYFAHYLKNMMKYNLLSHNRLTAKYDITEHGRNILKTYGLFNENFITENKKEICHNSNGNNGHSFYKVCKSCGIVEHELHAKAGLD